MTVNVATQAEALSITSLIEDMVDRHLSEQTFILAHADLASQVEIIADLLAALYQAVGAKEPK